MSGRYIHMPQGTSSSMATDTSTTCEPSSQPGCTTRSTLSHPLEPRLKQWWPSVTLAAAFITIFIVFQALGPANIMDYQLCRTTTRAKQIIDGWSPDMKLRAAFGLGLDYLFMPVYSTLFALWILCVVNRHSSLKVKNVAVYLAYGQWVAACFDAMENVASAVMLLHAPVDPWPAVSTVCASVKWALIVSGVLFMMVFFVLRLFGVCQCRKEDSAAEAQRSEQKDK